jgi:hypothetical protein
MKRFRHSFVLAFVWLTSLLPLLSACQQSAAPTAAPDVAADAGTPAAPASGPSDAPESVDQLLEKALRQKNLWASFGSGSLPST